jgi:hypothetical protein
MGFDFDPYDDEDDNEDYDDLDNHPLFSYNKN